MIKIEFNDQILFIPENWGDIKLGDYEKWFMQHPESKTDYVRFVAEVCKIDSELLLNSPTQLFDVIIKAISFIFENNFEPSSKVSIDGQNYFVSYGEKLTLGEWVDVESVLDSESEAKLSEMLSILCRPAGESYDPDLADERQELFRNQPCDVILPLIAFFLHRKKVLETISNHYSEAIVQANRFLQDTERFVANGGGTKRLPIWQRIRFFFLMRSLRKRLSKFSDSSFIE